MRAWFHAVSDRFERPGFVRGTDPLALSANVPGPDGKGTLTWGEYCAGIADHDKAIQNALASLDAYASALKAAATDEASLDTDLTGALAGDAADVARQLGTSRFEKAKELTGPVTALANVALDVVRTRKIRNAVKDGSGPVSTILRKTDDYLQAARSQLSDARDVSAEIAREADRVIPVWDGKGPVPACLPGQALALYEFSRIESSRLDALDAELTATSRLVGELREAHEGLVRGAEGGLADADVQRFVREKAQEIVKQVNVLRRVAR